MLDDSGYKGEVLVKWVARWFGREDSDKQFIECQKKLFRLAYSWCHDAQLAEDLVQETLLKAWQHRDNLRQEEAGIAWLCQVLDNSLHDHYRRHNKMPCINIEDEDHLSTYATPEENCVEQDTVQQVRHAIASLPLVQRQTLTLVDLEGLSYAEVAEALSVPIGTVMSRLSRARQALHQILLTPTQQPVSTNIKNKSVSYIRRVK